MWFTGHARRRTVRVLVTGATGFTGGHLARALAARGDTVSALVRTKGPAASALAQSGITLAMGDLRDPAALVAATAGVDVVYHIAAMYRQAGLSDDIYRAVNAIAVKDIIEAAARGGVRRVVHCSTVGVHGDVEHPPANEDAPLKPGDIYQVTKLEGEQLAREAGARLGIEVTIARPTGIYGPGDRRLLKLFRGVARRRWITLGDGEIYYHLTFIDDLVEGFRLCGTHPAAANRTYILAGGEVTTLNALVALVADAAGCRCRRGTCRSGRSGRRARCARRSAARFGIEPPILPPPRRLLHEEPGVRHHARADGDRVRAARRIARGHPPHAGLVPHRRMAVIDKAQEQLFAPGKSSRAKYAELVVGRPGLGALLKYELIVMFAQSWPGALGLAMRKALYPMLLGSCGRNVVFGQNVVLRHPHKIHIGSNVVIDDNCLLDAKGESNRGIRIGDGVFIGRNTILSCKNGDIELGDGANIGFNCEVFSASRVTIGKSVLMAAYSYVIGGDHDFSDPSKTGARADADVGRRDDRRRRLDGRRREDPRRRDDRRRRGHRRGRRRPRERARLGDRRRHSRPRRLDRARRGRLSGRPRRRHLEPARRRRRASRHRARARGRRARGRARRASRHHARQRLRTTDVVVPRPTGGPTSATIEGGRSIRSSACAIPATPSGTPGTCAGSITRCASTTTCGRACRRRFHAESRQGTRPPELIRAATVAAERT